MRVLIGLALLGLAVLAAGLPAVGARAQESPPGLGASLRLEALSASSLTVTWSWSGRAASAFEVAWRARGDDDDETAWRTARKDADDRRHVIENLDAGVHYVVRVRGLDAADRPIDDLRNVFATNWSAPRLLRVIASDDGALTVAWSQPSDWTPQGWRLSWRVAGSQTAGGTIDLPAAARSRRIDGLSTGADYRIRLTALNSRGGESPAQTLRATAADAGPATPRLTALSWSGLTIRAEWEVVPRASGYDLIWRASDESSGLAGRLEVAGTSAEFDLPAAGAYWVELQARIGAGPTARYSDRTPPRNLILRPAPHYLRALSFDGERVRLVWPGTNAPHYDLEWGEQGGAKQTETRDGRATLLEVGPLEGGTTYEFRVRARNVWGASGWSPTATLTPTLWPETPPPGLWLFAAFNHRTGGIDVTPPAVAGAPWYEAQWVNYADDAERGRARSSGAERRVRLSRAGGFENGLWYIRVRAGPWGAWSTRAHYHRVIGQPPRLALALESSRELCTAGTLTEVSWQISGGSAPYALSVENSPVDVSADNVRVNCGALTEAEAGDAEAALTAKTVTAVVTDSRGVRREAALEVARARALPAPTDVEHRPYDTDVLVRWGIIDGAGSQSPTTVDPVTQNRLRVSGVVRTRASRNDAAWSYHVFNRIYYDHSALLLDPPSDLRVLSVAVVRHPLELETPAALNWSEELVYTGTKPAQNVIVTTTHDTVTVSWDRQSYVSYQAVTVWLFSTDGSGGWRAKRLTAEQDASGRHSATFPHLPADTKLLLEIEVHGASSLGEKAPPVSHTVHTLPAPTGWSPVPAGPQNLRYTQTSGVTTVVWDDPYPDAQSNWFLTIDNPATGALWATRVYGTSWTLPAYLAVFADTEYRVTVEHHDVVSGSASILFRTPPAGPIGQAETPDVSPQEFRAMGFFPVWPVMVDSDYTMTDDPFQWRHESDVIEKDQEEPEGYYHRGLDIGEYSSDARRTPPRENAPPYGPVTGDGVYAATDGMLRIFADNLELESVFHCPSDDPLHEQFYTLASGDAWINASSVPADQRTDTVPLNTYCQNIATDASGRVAILSYTRRDGAQIVTKYGHLAPNGVPEEIALALASNADECDPTNADGPRCELDFRRAVSVRQGQRIATIGNSADGKDDDGFDQHVHFEILHFDIPVGKRTKDRGVLSGPWSIAKFCGPKYSHMIGGGTTTYDTHDCTWNKAQPREMGPALDVEAYLPPLPASPVPRNAWNVTADSSGVAVDTAKHLAEIEGARVRATADTTSLAIDLSVAFWRPSFYAQYYSNVTNDPGYRGQISRTGRAGITSTGPGVTGYGTDITAAPTKSDEACGGGTFQPAPAGSGESAEGELPRHTRNVSLNFANGPCTVHVLTTNSLYPAPEASVLPRSVDDSYRRNITIPDPKATLTWVAELSAGTDVTRSGESLTGDDLDLYTFTARRGNVYHFCTMPSGASACAPEAEAGVKRKKVNNVAELLIIGPDDEVEEGITRNAQGLKWVVPNNGPANDDYILVVRRRARWEGSGDPYSYNLKYTVPPIGVCDTLRLTLGAFLFVCTPAKPTDLSATTTDDTITATVTPSAGALEIEFAYLAAGANCTTTTEPAATVAVASSDAASGAAGAASATVSHPFGGLSASTTYKLCARSVRTIETGFVLRSGWVEASATTKAQQLAAPGSATPGSATTNSLTLTWTAVSDEDVGQYRVKHNRSTTTWTVASTETSYTFTGLSAGTAYILSVRALAKSGSGRTDSQWEPAASVRTKAQSTPPPVISPLTLTASVEPEDCYPGEEVSVSWSGSGGRGAHTYEVDDERATSPTKVVCQDEAGDQEIEVSATDSAGSTTTHTLSVTVLELREPINCLSSTVTGQFVTYQRGCGSTQAVSLLTALRNENSEVCGIGRWEGSNWLSYEIVRDGRAIPGSADFTINTGHMLWFVACGSESDGDGAVGASSGEPPHCPDALKPEAGPAVVGLDSSSCAIVRGGGAVQVSRGDYTLSLTLPSERDWFAAAPTHYNENAGGAFLLLDLASGGWAALDPAGGAELARYAPVDADGLSALLDAVGASVFVPAAGE